MQPFDRSIQHLAEDSTLGPVAFRRNGRAGNAGR